MRGHRSIVILTLVFVALATLYNVVTPLGEGPDEPGHAQYVLFLAREGRLPVQCAAPCVSDVPGAGHHPPLAYLLAAPLVSWLPREERVFDFPGNRRFTWAGGTQVNALAHGTRERWPWASEVWAWRMMRLASTAAGAATVVFAYLAARAIDCRFWILDFGFRSGQSKIQNPKSPIPLLAAALVALNPQFIFTAALVSNDALLAALGAALLWLVLRPRGTGYRAAVVHTAAVGAVLGLALLTKQSAVVLAPVVLGWAVAPEASRAWTPSARSVFSLRAYAMRPYAVRCMAMLGVAALVAGWWYWRNWRLYGDPFGLDLFRAEFTTQPFDVLSPAAWTQALVQLTTSFWARFGWLNVAPPAWVDWLYALLGLAAVAGLAADAMRRRRDGGVGGMGERTSPLHGVRTAYAVLVALPLLAFAWVLSFALTAGLVAWQGRLVFPAITAIATLISVGLMGWTRSDGRRANADRRGAPVGLWSLVLGLLVLALWLPFGVIRPAYPNPALSEAEALAGLGTPVYGRFARTDEAGAELRGWATSGAAQPGDTLELAFTWNALGRQNRDWWAFVHLIDRNGTIVAKTNAEVGGGVFPMLQWVQGDWTVDRQTLTLPPDLPPGTYTLRMGLWYPDTGRRARVYADGGSLLGDDLALTEIVVGK